jgi:nifR3 family TIM-barrel protein
VPVTIKFRMGTDDDHLTYCDSGRIGQEEGCAAVALHARTAAQLYDGLARWEAIGELKQRVTRIPVLGNGDIWEAEDALRMMRQTDCDGVVVGRGCLGRPWLFRDLADVFAGAEPQDPPKLGEIVEIMLRHARKLADWQGEGPAMRAFRRHSSWYTKGFRGSARLRADLMRVTTLARLQEVLAQLDPAEPFPPSCMRVPRGKTAGTQQVALPDGYLDALDDDTPPVAAAEDAFSGG